VHGEVRPQFCHAIDLMPTILDACGVNAPDVVGGVAQQPFDGASLLATFGDADAPAPRTTQYFELLGSRSIVHDGWKATTDHVSEGVADEERLLEGSRDFTTDRWALFRLDDDFSESHDVAAEHPDVVRALDTRWTEEAERNHVFPLVDSMLTRLTGFIGPPNPPGARCVFRPDASPATDESVPYLVGGFRLTAVVAVPERPEGVLCALGDWNAGFAFFVRDGLLSFVVNAAGDISKVAADIPVPSGGASTVDLACTFVPDAAGGSFTLTHDGVVVGRAASEHAMPLTWQHGGTALVLGHDTGFPVCDDYAVPFPWTGVIHEVVIEVPGPTLPDPEADLTDALRRD
jgi:hypothetical protein